jgi:hypothetical protein
MNRKTSSLKVIGKIVNNLILIACGMQDQSTWLARPSRMAFQKQERQTLTYMMLRSEVDYTLHPIQIVMLQVISKL